MIRCHGQGGQVVEAAEPSVDVITPGTDSLPGERTRSPSRPVIARRPQRPRPLRKRGPQPRQAPSRRGICTDTDAYRSAFDAGHPKATGADPPGSAKRRRSRETDTVHTQKPGVNPCQQSSALLISREQVRLAGAPPRWVTWLDVGASATAVAIEVREATAVRTRDHLVGCLPPVSAVGVFRVTG